MIEWYDFYIFGSLAAVISPLFYPQGNDTLALIAYLSTFAVGFVVRPFGALFFGRIGDLVGRKYAFLVTLLIMGGATAAIGLLPTYATIGASSHRSRCSGSASCRAWRSAASTAAPRCTWPSTSPDDRRGFYTSFIQITATLGLFLSLAVILLVQSSMSAEAFRAWGWRVPFLLSLAAGRHLALHPPAHAGIADLRGAEELRHDVGQRRCSEAFTDRAPSPRSAGLALRRHRRPGRRLVHRAVLRAVLPADDPQGPRDVCRLYRCGRAADGHAAVRRWSARCRTASAASGS